MSRDKKRLLTSSYEKGTLYELADAMVECFATGLKSGQPTYAACYRPEVVDAVCVRVPSSWRK